VGAGPVSPGIRLSGGAWTLRVAQERISGGRLVGFLTERGLVTGDAALLALWEEAPAHGISDDERREWFLGAVEEQGYQVS
jgi:hypothetical protein